MNAKRIISTVCVAALLLGSPATGLAESNDNSSTGVFSLQPTEIDRKFMDSRVKKEPEPTAWFVGNDGVTNEVPIITEEELKGLIEYNDQNNGWITPSFTEDYGTYIYQYNWKYYTQNHQSTDPYKFFQGSVSLENGTGSNMTLKYTQTQSKSNTWNITGKVEVEAEFKVAMLAKLSANVGGSVSDSWTTYSSSSVENTMTVRPGYKGTLSRYKQGAYSGGAGTWQKYKVVKATGDVTDLGTYFETGTAWGIQNNVDNYRAVEVKF